MGVFGHIMKIVMIILVVVLVVFVLAFAVMFLFPGFKLFGYHYISAEYKSISSEFLRGEQAEQQAMFDAADIILIETVGYDINLQFEKDGMALPDHSLYVSMSGGYRGFVKGSVDKPTYSSTNSTGEYFKDDSRPDKKIYYIKIAEPEQGFLMRAQTVLTVVLTDDFLEAKDVEIKTNSGSITFGDSVDVDESKTMNVKNLTIKSSSGAVSLNNMKNSGDILIEKSSKGKVFSEVDLKGNISVLVNGGSDKIVLKNIGTELEQSNRLTIKSHNGPVEIGNVFGDFEGTFNSSQCFIGNVSKSCIVNTKETVCNFKTVGTEGVAEVLQISVSGKTTLNFEKVYNSIDIAKNTNSTININESFANISYVGDRGTLNLSKVHASNIEIVEMNGKININAEKEEIVNIVSRATRGAISFSGIKYGTVLINEQNSQSSCNILGSFDEVLNKHIIKTTSGKIEVSAPSSVNYSIFWDAKKANLNIFGPTKTTIKSSAEYCDTNGRNGWSHTNSQGQPCEEEMDGNLSLSASSGTVIVNSL